MPNFARRIAPLALAVVLGATAACDNSTVPTELAATGGDVEVIDGITFKKTSEPLILATVTSPMDDFVCDTIDFSEFQNGDMVTATSLFGNPVGVEITEFGPTFEGSTGTGDAVIYDTDLNGGQDPDLEAAGQSVTPTLGNVIVHQEDGSPIPDDADVWYKLLFDFTPGDYLVQGFAALDQEGSGDLTGEYIALRIDVATDGSEVAITDVTLNNDEMVEFVDVMPDAAFQNTLEFFFNGSGAIDNIEVCERTERGEEGCTPGYCKQEHHFGSWPVNPYTTLFSDAFPTACGLMDYPAVQPEADLGDICDLFLLDVLSLRGGSVNALARHAAAGWLNAMSSVDYPWSTGEVEAAFMAGDKGLLEDANESYCPLGRDEGDWVMPMPS